MLIFYQLFPHCRRRRLGVVIIVGVSSSFLASKFWRLVVEVVVIGVSSLLMFFRCCKRCPFLWLSLSVSATHRRRRLIVFIGDGVTSIETNISFCS